jgi:hypothetical protein
MTMLRRAFLVSLILGAILTTAASVQADPIVTPVGTANNNSFIRSGQYNLVRFTLGASYTNVAIAASLISSLQGQTGTAFLMNQVGPGTTVANQLAVSPFNFVFNTNLQTVSYVSLFSGLSLVPGTYYVVMASNSPNTVMQGITVGTGVTYSTAPGTTVGVPQFTSGTNLNAIYPPASTWVNSGTGNRFFTVTGDPTGTEPIPEPATLLLLGAGLGGIAAKLRRRRARRKN